MGEGGDEQTAANNNGEKPEQKVRPIIINDVQPELKKSTTELSKIFKEWKVYDLIERVTLDKNKNLAVFAKSVSEAKELFEHPKFFQGNKKVNLKATESLPAAIFKEEVDIDELKANVSYLKSLGVADLLVIEPKSARLYADASQPKSNTVKLFFTSFKERDELVKTGLKLAFRVYKLEPSIRIMQCLNCKQFGHTVSKCNKNQKCARCNFEGDLHDEKKCTKAFCCANCNENHSAFDRSCSHYRQFKKEQLLKTQSGTKRATATSPSKDSVRKWSEAAKASDNSNAEILAILKRQEVSMKNHNSNMKNEILSVLKTTIETCHASIQQQVAISNVNTGLALHEILTKVLPDKAAAISHAVNEAYPKYSLGNPNTQPIYSLAQVHQTNAPINLVNNVQHLRPQTVLTIGSAGGQITQAFGNIQQQVSQQPQQQQQQQSFFVNTQTSQTNKSSQS